MKRNVIIKDRDKEVGASIVVEDIEEFLILLNIADRTGSFVTTCILNEEEAEYV